MSARKPPCRQDKGLAAALMRINHVGEVCAQGLYQGQALGCRDAGVRQALKKPPTAEHLAWTERRLRELGGRKSALNPTVVSGVAVDRHCCGEAW